MIGFYRRRLGALGAVLAGAALALYRMDAETRTRVLAGLLAWLAGNWLGVMPWLICGALFLLWRGETRRRIFHMNLAAENERDYLQQYVTTQQVRAQQDRPRPRSKVGSGRRTG